MVTVNVTFKLTPTGKSLITQATLQLVSPCMCPLMTGQAAFCCKLLPTVIAYTMHCLCFVFSSTSNFFSYLATVTFAGDRTANFDQCLEFTVFSSEGSFKCHTYCDTEPPLLIKVISERSVILTSPFINAKSKLKKTLIIIAKCLIF
jgi:hypothetical protein